MTACIKKALVFISEKEVEERKEELEQRAIEEISLQPEFGETRTLQEQYESRLQKRLEELEADCVQAPRIFIDGKRHTAIFYRDELVQRRVLFYSRRISC